MTNSVSVPNCEVTDEVFSSDSDEVHAQMRGQEIFVAIKDVF